MSFPDIEMQKDSLTKYLAFKIIFQFTFFHLKKQFFIQFTKLLLPNRWILLNVREIDEF